MKKRIKIKKRKKGQEEKNKKEKKQAVSVCPRCRMGQTPNKFGGLSCACAGYEEVG